MSITIMTNIEAKQQEREKQSQELQDRLVVKLEDEEKRTFDKGEEEYEHMLMDLQELSLGVTHMDEGEWVRRAPAPPTASILFDPGEEREAHRSLDSLLEPEEKESTAKSTIMDWDEAGDRSLMEWQEEEEPERVRKRKREKCKRSNNIPPEKKASTMKKKR